MLVELGLIEPTDAPFLPPGFWPVPPANGGTNSWARGTDPSRIRFLRRIGASPIPSVKPLNGRRYEGWLAQAASGRLVGFVECTEVGNALYVFDASIPTWTSTAVRSKWELLREKPPAFVGRVRHAGDWQARVEKLLHQL